MDGELCLVQCKCGNCDEQGKRLADSPCLHQVISGSDISLGTINNLLVFFCKSHPAAEQLSAAFSCTHPRFSSCRFPPVSLWFFFRVRGKTLCLSIDVLKPEEEVLDIGHTPELSPEVFDFGVE